MFFLFIIFNYQRQWLIQFHIQVYLYLQVFYRYTTYAKYQIYSMIIKIKSKVKTVNLDDDTLKQNLTVSRFKPSIPKFKINDERRSSKSFNQRSFTQRLNRNNMCNSNQPQQEVDVFGRVHYRQYEKSFAEKDYVFSKKYVKTNLSNPKHSFQSQKTYALKRYNPILGGLLQSSNYEIDFQNKEKIQKQQLCKTPQKQMVKIESKPQVNDQFKHILNPYTKDQYIYMRNKREDQRKYLQQKSKMERISSIMKSYKISPISLIPQTHKRTNSMKLSTLHNKRSSAYSPVRKESLLSPSPWEWGNNQYSKDDLP